MLIKAGWDIIDWRMFGRLHRLRREHLIVMLTTLCLTVFVDLITAVVIGPIAGRMLHARRLERLELDSVMSVPFLDAAFFAGDETSTHDDPFAARVGMVALKGTLIVASSHKLVSVISLDIKEHEVVIFDFSGTVYIDDSAAMVIGQLLEVAAGSDTECIVTGLSEDVAATLHSLDIRCQPNGSSQRLTKPVAPQGRRWKSALRAKLNRVPGEFSAVPGSMRWKVWHAIRGIILATAGCCLHLSRPHQARSCPKPPMRFADHWGICSILSIQFSHECQ